VSKKVQYFATLLLILLITLVATLEFTTKVYRVTRDEYEPTWESLDAHQVPQWFEDAKFGMFIHWGVYSVPAWAPINQSPYAEWYWYHLKDAGSPTWKYHREHYGENFTYDDFIPMFKAENYDPEEWVRIAKDAGMKYIIITTKHHDGFSLWPSQYTTRDAGDMGPKRDLIGPLVEATRRHGLKIGFYYSLLDWWHPDYPNSEYVEYAHNQVKELVSLYHPDILYLDGHWEHPSDFWKSKELVAWYYNEAEDPNEVCVNDRLGQETRGAEVWGVYGDFATPEYEVFEEITDYKWESTRGIGYSFGYNRAEGPEDYMSVEGIIKMLVDIVSKNGNLLLDVGPKADGTIPEVQKERLEGVGEWLAVNGEAIYGTRPWPTAEEGNVRFTTHKDTVYLISFGWSDETLTIQSIKARDDSSIRLLGVDKELEWIQENGGLRITMPSEKPCEYAYVLKIEACVLEE
jgi:alpha-L-fucosidase